VTVGRRLAWVAAVLAAILLLAAVAVFGSWFVAAGARGGLDATLRFIRYGPTTIDDHRHYPGRRLTASTTPFRFATPAVARMVPAVVETGPGRPRRLEQLLHGTGTIALVIVQKDELAFEWYGTNHGAASPSQLFSVSKSITSVLVGAAIEDGILRSVDQPLVELVPELAGRGFADVTLEHLLTMTSGSDYVEDDHPFGVHVPFNYTSDIERMMLAFAMERDPGTVYRYKSGDTALLSLALSRALAPRTLTDYAQERLWTPLGMEDDGVWSLDREGGLEKAWCCLAATARDLAKIGRLYLEGGIWEGTSVLSSAWIERSVGSGAVLGSLWPAGFAAAGFRGYGYGWWLLSEPEGDYLAQGKDGQFLYVNPLRGTVIVRLGRGQGELTTGAWAWTFRYLAGHVR
jgi:CubicO group peptidase (beta-lactamase class C family)